MIEFSDEVKSTLADARIRITETAYNHVTTAIGLFESYAYSQACFLAITAIEEMGKARTLQVIQSDINPSREPKKIDAKGIQDFLTNHKPKAIRAAASGLSANHGAARRHGRHKEADLNLSSGILFLAKSGKWTNIRESCLYTDVNIPGKSIEWPTDEIAAHHAYYFICMALEILAEESDAGLGAVLENLEVEETVTDFETATGFRSAMLRHLEQFRIKYEDQFEPEELAFFVDDPRYNGLREEIRKREVDLNMGKRKRLRESIAENVEEMDVEEDNLPENIDLEDYRDYLMTQMVDTAMDAPYFTPQELHPDLEDLSEHMQKYMEY